MRHVPFLFALILVSTPALAGGWQSGMVEDEGGSVMQAWVDAGEGDVPADLRLMCAGEEGLSVRYAFGSDVPEGAELPTGEPVNFDTYLDDAYIILPMQYEEMDGAYAAYMKPDAPFIRMLKSGKTIKIADATGVYHDVTFSLSGSTKSIDAVLKSCE